MTTSLESPKVLLDPVLFDPAQGQTALEPVGSGKGYWVGACSAVRDPSTGKYYLYYRIREPRPVRGGRCRIAESGDGVHFETIWESAKSDYETTSIERGALFRSPGSGKWRLYLSYVDPADQRWRVDAMEADSPDQFQPSERWEILTAAGTGTEGVKDPYAFIWKDKVYLLLSYATGIDSATDEQRQAMHETSDIYNTGLTKSSSALAVSADGGKSFEWLGDIFQPSESGWDQYAARLSAVIYRAPLFIGFYDGSASVAENYEERLGVAVSLDLRRWIRVTEEKPLVEAPHATGSIRYLDVIESEEGTRIYYEYTRADGSHEIRTNLAPSLGLR